MNKIEIYTSNFCLYCTAAKRLLNKLGVEFNEINLGKDPEGRAELAARTGLRTFPQIVVNGEPIGGYDQFRAEVASGAFSRRLDPASAPVSN